MPFPVIQGTEQHAMNFGDPRGRRAWRCRSEILPTLRRSSATRLNTEEQMQKSKERKAAPKSGPSSRSASGTAQKKLGLRKRNIRRNLVFTKRNEGKRGTGDRGSWIGHVNDTAYHQWYRQISLMSTHAGRLAAVRNLTVRLRIIGRRLGWYRDKSSFSFNGGVKAQGHAQ